MSLFTILETLLIGPLKLLFELIFQFAGRFVDHPGICIIFLSLVMNILVLPLYKRADAMQEDSRLTEEKLGKGVAHIKKTFSGDEKMMILQTYYRQNNYKPTNALKGSVSLLLEIPFFMAAYQFLSHLDALRGISFGPIADLSAPDGLLVIGGIAINVLPVLMTLVNVVSAAMYLKGFPLKTKIQLYGMALFFLVFLYTSPSGLVFYWTLNNVFSLVKNIFYKIKNPAKVLRILTAALGIACIGLGVVLYRGASVKKMAFLIALGLMLIYPALQQLLKGKLQKPKAAKEVSSNKKMFVWGCVFLTVLVGLMIPTTYIAASPQEYVDTIYFHHPLWYIVSTVAMAAGFFLVWLRVFYWLANEKWKVLFERIVWIACGVMLVNYMFFGTDLGVISASLKYEEGLRFSLIQQLVNLGAIALVAAVLWFAAVKFPKFAVSCLLIASIAMGVMSGVHIFTIRDSVDQITLETADDSPNFQLSTTGQNVVVIMLDRAMGEYVPYLFNEDPALQEQFAGFTYYSNTISHGGYTNFGTPGLLGGYEYTPVEMNKRDAEWLVNKHNEALLMMPVLFAQNGFDVTVCDPPYPNYQWIPDLSIYKAYPQIDTYITDGQFGSTAAAERFVTNNHRNFFCFSLMKTLPVILQSAVYNDGNYNQAAVSQTEVAYSTQTVAEGSTTVAEGISKAFMDGYNALTNLPNITKITDEQSNTFLFFANNTTHEPTLLQEPDYLPAQNVDNTQFDAENTDRFTVDGKTMEMSTLTQKIHYQTNMAALRQLGDWLDYLRESGVYDNTRIIIAADHGRYLSHFDELEMGEEDDLMKNVEAYYPLLMVKDFGSTQYTQSDEFMTNADVPTLAVSGVIENPVNPFTGKLISSEEKTAHPQYIILSEIFDTAANCGTTYLPSRWASVEEDLWDPENWKFYDQETVLQEHSFPAE